MQPTAKFHAAVRNCDARNLSMRSTLVRLARNDLLDVAPNSC
jgi:hypothetical protein